MTTTKEKLIRNALILAKEMYADRVKEYKLLKLLEGQLTPEGKKHMKEVKDFLIRNIHLSEL